MSPAYKAYLRTTLRKAQGGCCYWCGHAMLTHRKHRNSPRGETLDHIAPRSRGGTSHVMNIVLACRKCNLEKGSGPAPMPAGVGRRGRSERRTALLCQAIGRYAA